MILFFSVKKCDVVNWTFEIEYLELHGVLIEIFYETLNLVYICS